PGRAILADDTRETDFDLRPFSAAPGAMRDRVRDLRYPLVLAAGFGYQARPELMLNADVRQRLRGSSPFEPATHAGVGAEYRPVAWLPLRAGTAILSGGYLLSTGIGIQTGA